MIDELFHALVWKDHARLDAFENARSAEAAYLRALISTDHESAIDLDLGLGVASNDQVTRILAGPRAYFISGDTSVQAQLTGGKSIVLLDYSLSFDSNFAEKLRAVISGEKVQDIDRDRVLGVLRLKATNPQVQFDLLPFLYENVRLVRSDEKNLRPVSTLIAFRMIDHLNWDAFARDTARFDFGMDAEALRASLQPAAAQYLAKLHHDPDVLKHEALTLAIQALLLRFAKLWHTPVRDPKVLLGKLIDFCVFELGFIPSTELSIVWTGFQGKEVKPFFGPIVGRAKKMLAEIRGMAWDMTHLRLMERAVSKSHSGSFFVPYYVSLDRRWRELLRLNPVSMVLIDSSKRSMLTARANEAQFLKALDQSTSARAMAELSPDKVHGRRIAAQSLSADAMRRLVAQEEGHWP